MRTVRKVIGTGKVIAAGNIKDICYALDEIAEDTPIEIVARLPVEKKMIRPEDVEWKWIPFTLTPGNCCTGMWALAKQEHEVVLATVHASSFHTVSFSQQCTSENVAMSTAEEYLANMGMGGFGWEQELEPECEAYFLRHTNSNGKRIATGWHSIGSAINFCRECESHGSTDITLIGITADNQIVEVDWQEGGEYFSNSPTKIAKGEK